ncbi:MAG: hypothetical protein QGD91_11790 [Actinomycetota bacterium]|nr:hypothetical protein [Actinomycetota bacterium]
MSHTRVTMFLDTDSRAYLTKLGFDKETTLIADRVEGDELAWVIRRGRVVTDLEASILANAEALESLIRPGQEAAAGVDTVELT